MTYVVPDDECAREASTLLGRTSGATGLMLNDGTPIDLVTRLRTMSRVLDILVPESPSAALEEAVGTALEAVGRRELAEAMMLLEEGVEYGQKAEPVIATIEQGLAMCASGLRLFSAQGWGKTLERINGPVAHNRIRNTTERLRRYERMLRHRLAMPQIHRGCLDEAIAQWPALDDEPCAS